MLSLIHSFMWRTSFEWYNLFDDRRVLFAKIKLTRQACIWWCEVEDHLACMGQHPIIYWDEMKMKLKFFLPPNYKKNLYDQLVTLE